MPICVLKYHSLGNTKDLDDVCSFNFDNITQLIIENTLLVVLEKSIITL